MVKKMQYGVYVPYVYEYKKTFSAEIAKEQGERDSCNKKILETIANDTKTFGQSYWQFDLSSCRYNTHITNYLGAKGFKVKHKTNTLTVTLNKY